MPDHSARLAGVARKTRFAWEQLVGVSDALLELNRGKLAAEVLDLEVKLLDLHQELIELACRPLESPAKEQRADSLNERRRFCQDELPF